VLLLQAVYVLSSDSRLESNFFTGYWYRERTIQQRWALL